MELGILLFFMAVLTVPFFFFKNQPSFSFNMQFLKHAVVIDKQPYLRWLILPILLVMIIALFGRSLEAKWNVIDDHEIMYFLGPDGKLPVADIFSTFSATEVGNFGLRERFRPSYYFLRIFECVLWGANPVYWHIFRLAILWLGISLVWHLVSGRLGWLGGGIFCAYLLTFPFWADTIAKLGAGETYAVIGLPVYTWGVIQAFKPSRSIGMQFLSGISLLVGSLICIGSKENFLLLILPSLFTAWKAFSEKKYPLIFFALASVAFALYVGNAVAVLLARSGTDVYQNAISPFARGKVFLDALSTSLHLPTLSIFVFLILFLSGLLLLRRLPKEVRRVVRMAVFWLVALLAVFCSQIVFYNGVWPRGNRYDFPGILYIPLTAYVLYVLVCEATPRLHGFPITRNSVGIVFSAALFLMVLTKGYGGTVEQVRQYVDSTNRFTSQMQKLALTLKQNPDYALVLESDDMWQYEPVISTQRFLRAYGAQNPLFLRNHCYSPEMGRTAQEKFLAVNLEKISSRGSSLFFPVSQLDAYQDQCFSLELVDYEFWPCVYSAASFECVNNQ